MMKLTTAKYGTACTKKTLVSLFLILLTGSVGYGQKMEPQIAFSKHEITNKENRTQHKILAECIASDTDYYEIRISNLSADTVYLFTSYFDEDLYRSPFLHKYAQKSGECVLSFLPIPYYMAYQRSDVMVFGQRRVASQFQVMYEFEVIEPFDYIALFIPKDCFNYGYVKNYQPQEMSKAIRPRFQTINKIPNCLTKKIEFAIYKNVGWLTRESFYYDEYTFDKLSKGYNIVAVMVNC